MHVGAFGSSIKFDLRNSATNRTSQQRKADAALKRLRCKESFVIQIQRILNRPGWMVVQYIPVIPQSFVWFHWMVERLHLQI
jgi:DNA-directed RNA polymerase beta' subunit